MVAACNTVRPAPMKNWPVRKMPNWRVMAAGTNKMEPQAMVSRPIIMPPL